MSPSETPTNHLLTRKKLVQNKNASGESCQDNAGSGTFVQGKCQKFLDVANVLKVRWVPSAMCMLRWWWCIFSFFLWTPNALFLLLKAAYVAEKYCLSLFFVRLFLEISFQDSLPIILWIDYAQCQLNHLYTGQSISLAESDSSKSTSNYKPQKSFLHVSLRGPGR